MIKSKYITPDDIKENFPELHFEDSIGSEQEQWALIKRAERRINTYIDANFYRKVEQEYPTFTDYQKLHYQYALMEQVVYMFKNGDISIDSGYDPAKGEVLSREKLTKLAIAENAKEELMLCGLWCRKIRTRSRNGFDDWWRL